MAFGSMAELEMFAAVARARSFRGAAAAHGVSAGTLSGGVRRLEERLDARLLNRTTRSVTLTGAGAELLALLEPALECIGGALDAVNGFRKTPRGRLRLNVPSIVSDVLLPPIVRGFLERYPDIQLEVTADDQIVDIFEAGYDAGVRYDERLAQDVIAVPLGPRTQRYAVAAAPVYWAQHDRPAHPSDLMQHVCIRHRFSDRASSPWEFERGEEVVKVDPPGALAANTLELRLQAALRGVGIIASFEHHLAPHLEAGTLEPVLEDWWPSFTGPMLYFPVQRHMRAPLRVFVDYLKEA